MKFIFIFTAILFYSAQLLSNEISADECGTNSFSSRYYLLDISNVSGVSAFFKEMEAEYFNEIRQISGITGIIGKRQRIETYFDFNDLRLLKYGKELLITEDEHLPDYRSGRKWITYRDNSRQPPLIQRFEFKRYNKKISPLDKHPLLGSIKRRERSILTDELDKMGVDFIPAYLKKNFEVFHDEVVYLISHFGEPYASISLDQFHISSYGIPNTSTLLKIEKFYDNSDDLASSEKAALEKTLCRLNSNIRNSLPSHFSRDWFGYVEYNTIIKKLIPTRDLFQKYPLLFTLGQILILLIIGFLFLYLLIGRYEKRASYRFIKLAKYLGHGKE